MDAIFFLMILPDLLFLVPHELRTQEEMCTALKLLKQLSYILECVALNYLGEGKSALMGLCQQLESDITLAIEQRARIAQPLKQVLEAYRMGNIEAGTSLLVQVN